MKEIVETTETGERVYQLLHQWSVYDNGGLVAGGYAKDMGDAENDAEAWAKLNGHKIELWESECAS